MKEYLAHIHHYLDYWQADFSKLVPSSQWGNKDVAEKYLEKYWLPEQEYLNIWKPIQDKVFIPGKSLPDLIYRPEFEMTALRGGCLFLEEDFKVFQNIAQAADEKHFVVIQHSQDFTVGEPMFRMKFPVIITWEELISGNYISSVLFEMMLNGYYVFTENGNWGRYSDNDYKHPMDIFGFKPKYEQIFRTHLSQPPEEWEEIKKWLPPKYKEIITQ